MHTQHSVSQHSILHTWGTAVRVGAIEMVMVNPDGRLGAKTVLVAAAGTAEVGCVTRRAEVAEG